MIKQIIKKNQYIVQQYEKIKKNMKVFWVQRYGIKELESVLKILNGAGVCSFADFGTLLGLMREKELLKHDADVDVGIVVQDKETIGNAKAVLKEQGYQLIREFTVDKVVKEQSYRKNHVKIDLQFYTFEEDTDLMCCYLFYNPLRDRKEKYWKSVIKKCPKVVKLQPMTIGGKDILLPQNAEEVLAYKYGPNWRIPDKSWVYWEGPNTYPTDEVGLLKSIYNGGIQK